eukprot:scaffold39372_cov41-Cyclotella_meneghiniana.AAC.1
MSQCEYNEWCDDAEIGLHCLKLSLQADFLVAGGDNFGLTSPLFTPRLREFGYCYKHFTAAGPFQCLIVSIPNGEMRL